MSLAEFRSMQWITLKVNFYYLQNGITLFFVEATELISNQG